MVGPDSIRICPDNRRLKLVPGLKGMIPRLIYNEFHGSPTNWEYLGSQRAVGKFSYADTTQWCDALTGTWFRAHCDRVVSVQANLSRLLTGKDHNGYVLNTQEEIDQAMANLYRTLDSCSEGPASGEITSVEVGGVVKEPLSTFEALLRLRSLPNLKKAPDFRPGESMKFGAAQKSQMSIMIYDKERKHGAGRGTYTRVETRLSRDRLRKEFGVKAVRSLDLVRLKEIFYKTVYLLDPDGTARVNSAPGDIVGLVSLVLQCGGQIDGVPILETWLQNKSPVYAKRVIKEAQKINIQAGCRRLRDIIPQEPENPYIHLDLIKSNKVGGVSDAELSRKCDNSAPGEGAPAEEGAAL